MSSFRKLFGDFELVPHHTKISSRLIYINQVRFMIGNLKAADAVTGKISGRICYLCMLIEILINRLPPLSMLQLTTSRR